MITDNEMPEKHTSWDGLIGIASKHLQADIPTAWD